MYTFPPAPTSIPRPDECQPYVDNAIDIFQANMQWVALLWVFLLGLMLGSTIWAGRRQANMEAKMAVKRIAEATEKEREMIFEEYGVNVGGKGMEGGEV
jgi:predicted negative regulator of RcsB-dependent stress response